MNDYVNSQAVASKVSAAMKRVYLQMTLAMVISGFTAYFCSISDGFKEFFINHSGFMWILVFVELGLVFGLSSGINRMKSGVAVLMLMVFAAVNGLTLTPIMWVYTGSSLASTFFITAGVFGAMSIYGFTTKTDLTKFGSILIMALFGLIIASLVNIFLKSSGLYWAISFFGVLLFIGLTAWDTQQIKRMVILAPDDSLGKVATIGALNLYLDFINLFLFLLRFFGNSND